VCVCVCARVCKYVGGYVAALGGTVLKFVCMYKFVGGCVCICVCVCV
jgi:hypothetical protein